MNTCIFHEFMNENNQIEVEIRNGIIPVKYAGGITSHKSIDVYYCLKTGEKFKKSGATFTLSSQPRKIWIKLK